MAMPPLPRPPPPSPARRPSCPQDPRSRSQRCCACMISGRTVVRRVPAYAHARVGRLDHGLRLGRRLLEPRVRGHQAREQGCARTHAQLSDTDSVHSVHQGTRRRPGPCPSPQVPKSPLARHPRPSAAAVLVPLHLKLLQHCMRLTGALPLHKLVTALLDTAVARARAWTWSRGRDYRARRSGASL